MKTSQRSLRSIAAALALSLCGGGLFTMLRIPLPWMLGPLFCVGLAGISGVRVSDGATAFTRIFGASSAASARVSPSTAPFAMATEACEAKPCATATVENSTTEAASAAFSPGSAA